MGLAGSLEYELRWKNWDMVLGLPICALRGSARRISDSGCTGWPTPMDNDSHGSTHCYGPKKAGGSRPIFLKLPGAAKLAGWPTPNTDDQPGKNHGRNLGHKAEEWLSGWATPSSRDWKDSTGMATTGINPDGSERSRLDQLPRPVAMAGWPTPTALSFKDSHQP